MRHGIIFMAFAAFLAMYGCKQNPSADKSGNNFTIDGGQRFTILLPVVTKQMYPKEQEIHTVRIGFGIS